MNFANVIPFVLGGVSLLVILSSMRKGYKIKDVVSDLPRRSAWPRRDINSITDITIHHSAGTNTQTAEDFARWHKDDKGWPGIGYHYVINRDGSIEQTNYLSSKSYHNGYNNGVAVGVCLVGDFTRVMPSDEQLKACTWLCRHLKRELKSVKYIMGHKEYKGSTQCPGRYPVAQLRKDVGLSARQSSYLTSAISPLSLFEGYNPSQADN